MPKLRSIFRFRRRHRHSQSLIWRLWQQLGDRRRRQFALLMVLMLISSLADVVTLSTVLPFLGLLTNPEVAFENPVVQFLARAIGVTTGEQLLLPLTLIFVLLALTAGLIRLLLLWVNTRLAFATGADLSIAVYRRTLYQPYQVHISRHSSEVITTITSKVNAAISVLNQLLVLTSATIQTAAILLTLISINPVIALSAGVGFGASYGLITGLARHWLSRSSETIARESTQMLKILQEGLGGIRDVLLNGNQSVYCRLYRQADRPFRLAQGNAEFLAQSPAPAMEAISIVLIALLAYGLSQGPTGVASALPMLGVLALGAKRLMPVLQQGYSAWATITSHQASLSDVLTLLEQPLPAEAWLSAPHPLSLQRSVQFESVSFRYTPEGPDVLKDITFTIPKGAHVGFVGETGSGKSTLLDLFMGLITPTQGHILVDGYPLTGDRRRAWQRAIAHVPQNIYLADTTIAENIAFGVPPENIQLDRVHEAARQAQVADFIESLPEGYNTLAGERGVRLSGGQRQRIGIARALYQQATVLVFDEATSALDNSTEKAVMRSLENADQCLTTLFIAHRLTTVQHCDFIVELQQGKLLSKGTYEQLLRQSPSFQAMASK